MSSRLRPRAGAVALVTGGARRIGREIALALADDGWQIAVHYAGSRAEALITVDQIVAAGGRAIAINRDLSYPHGVRSMLAECAAELGTVTCVVNNASMFQYDDAAHFSPELLHKHVAVNAAAPVLLAHALHAQLAIAPTHVQGVVINLLDQKLWNPNPDFLSYTMSKAALACATTLLAQALAPRVRVVGVAPGITLPSGDQDDAEFARAHRQTPLGASSTPEDVAQAVAFLARARSVTGTTLLVDGGQHLAAADRDVMFLTRERADAAGAAAPPAPPRPR